MSQPWRVELHSHTLWSKDCIVAFETILNLCERRGVDKIAITDHNTAEGALRMQRMAPDRIIVGEEIMTTQGELLAFFVQETIPASLTPQETIRELRAQGAVISVSHPFDRLRKGAWEEADLRAIVEHVDAIEVFNSRCLFAEDNARAAAFAQSLRLRGTAGSDAHSRPEYGRGLTLLAPFSTPAEFISALDSADYVRRYSPAWVHANSTTAKWSRKLGLRPRLWKGG
ncbi:MAG: PHP domain-containing protein [Anaerolineae bacterium]|nr:PHP domain-containing protein [Anaerolineae bacterium]